MSELEELRAIVFNMLNFTNMYCLVLDQEMIIKYVNLSLAIDLGYNSYDQLIGRCWHDFLPESERKLLAVIHHAIANGTNNWETKYREVENDVITKDGKKITVYWFNSHINTDINWSFSFGIKKLETEKEEEDIRDFYYDIIKKDRVVINSMRDALGLRDKIVDTCKPTFMDNKISFG